jgi:hypothetical protein
VLLRVLFAEVFLKYAVMLCLAVFNKLVFPVIADVTLGALIGLLIDMSSGMIIAVANCCKSLGAVAAFVGFLARVDSHVN